MLPGPRQEETRTGSCKSAPLGNGEFGPLVAITGGSQVMQMLGDIELTGRVRCESEATLA